MRRALFWPALLWPLAANAVQFDFSFDHSDLSDNYGSWNDYGVIARLDQETPNPWIIEASTKSHFNETSVVGVVSHTRTYSDHWYQDFTVQAATNARITPGWTVFSEIHRKVLQDLSLVPGLGVGYSKNQDPYSDFFSILEFTYYANAWLVTQAGLRLNISNPGSVQSLRTFIAAEVKPVDRLRVALKVDTGAEGYALLGSTRTLNTFRSTSERIQIHYQIQEHLSFGPVLELYQSPAYRRTTLGLGFSILP